jgi:hypothetical protein
LFVAVGADEGTRIRAQQEMAMRARRTAEHFVDQFSKSAHKVLSLTMIRRNLLVAWGGSEDSHRRDNIANAAAKGEINIKLL